MAGARAALLSESRGPAPSGPRPPKIASCDQATRSKLAAAYQTAFGWARATAAWLRQWIRSPALRREWNAGPVGRLFGPFSTARARRLWAVVRGVVDRFERGFEHDGRRMPTTLMCLPASYRRCSTGLLGNASIYGTLRFCPRLLEQDVPSVAKVVLHELMHQGLGVGDRRHEDCEGSKHRCYREGARDLVEAGRYDLAGRNIDNYVTLMRHVGTRGGGPRVG
jgi:hypothetical protein